MINAKLGSVSLLLVSGAMACTVTTRGSGEDEPVAEVIDVSPRDGDYGTTITVTGRNLEEHDVVGVGPRGERIKLFEAPAPKKKSSSSAPDGGTDAPAPGTSLTFRFPFPAEGEMSLVSPGGEIPIGAFTPSFTPGRPYDVGEGAQILGAAALGADTAVLVKRASGLSFIVFGAGEPRVVDVESGATDIGALEGVLVHGSVDAVEIVLESNGAPHLLTFDGTRTTVTPFTLPEGSYLGAGVDESGFVIVMTAGSDGIVRYRGAPDALAADGPPVPLPSGSNAKLAVSGDGSVVRAWSSNGGSTFDDMVRFSMAGLGPNERTFGPAVTLGSLDDTFKSLEMSVESGIVHLSYCATDTGIASKPETHCGSSDTVDGRSQLSVPNAQGISYAAGRVVAASCRDNGIALGSGPPDGQLALEPTTALYPCGGANIETIVSVPTGNRIVATREGKLYVVRRR